MYGKYMNLKLIKLNLENEEIFFIKFFKKIYMFIKVLIKINLNIFEFIDYYMLILKLQ